MDVRFPTATATAAETEALDRAFDDGVDDRAPLGSDGVELAWERERGGVHRAASRRHLLLGGLHALQDRVGYISEGGLSELCQRLDVPPSEAYGVASFYALFALTPAPARTVHVCVDLACATRKADSVFAALETAARGREDVRVTESPCLGLCERAPAVLVSEAGEHPHEVVVAPLQPGSPIAMEVDVASVIERGRVGVASGPGALGSEAAIGASIPQRGDPALVLLRRVGVVDPTSLADYESHGGYTALRRALEIGPAAVVEEISASKLLGRGGAAFPAGRKWASVAAQPAQPHYLVCNADESEPGTFKDRVLLEGDPFSVIESMTIAAYATGCAKGYLYLRGEFPRARENLSAALVSARAANRLGADILSSGFSFDIEIVRGAGAYICGEETAIFNSIEGFRGEPRSKPPFPVEVGLFGKPTLVNNVETLANVLPIVLQGGDAFAAIGTEGSTGPKLFCVSGAVARPGVYEVPFGETLRGLIERAGGVPSPLSLRAVLLGGAAGGFVSADRIDFPLTFEGARAAGSTLGSGVVFVIDNTTDIAPLLRRIAAFFKDESCGQCVPCRVGTVRQQETLDRLVLGGARDGDLGLLREIGQAMRDASICGLGQTAWNAIESALDGLGFAERLSDPGSNSENGGRS